MPLEQGADALALGRGPDAVAGPAVPHKKIGKQTPDSSYQNYLFGKSGHEDRPAWSDSVKGRAGIRLVSRGIVGAAFFTIGGRMARHQLEFYNPEAAPENILQAVAKGIDLTFGRGFKKLIKTAAGFTVETEKEAIEIAEKAMEFRQSRDFYAVNAAGEKMYEGEYAQVVRNGKTVYDPILGGQRIQKTETVLVPSADTRGKIDKISQPLYEFHNGKIEPKYLVHKEKGRSYGAEVVSFTFDFACASVGDATTRNLFQVFDPNVKKSWLLNDDNKPATHGEHKHIDWTKWAKSTASTTWRIFSKNQGEDWAAAIPYAFQMKFQSKFLNSAFMGKRGSDGRNRFEGHDLVFDSGWNGGAYLRNEKGQIVGDHQLAGAIDLHARFVGYNWYTLMFREAYDRIGHAFTEWKKDGFAIHAPHLPQHFNPLTASVDGLATSARYLTKSFIKANMYMNPAVVPFWVLRTSQSKWRGTQFIEPESNVLNSPLCRGADVTMAVKNDPYAAEHFAHYPKPKTFMDNVELNFSKGMNWMGRWQYKLGSKTGEVASRVGTHSWFPRFNKLDELVTLGMHTSNPNASRESLLPEGFKHVGHEYMDAALSYTPYMFAKAEFGLRVDDSKGDGKPGNMDKAIYRFMDNVAAFNLQGSWQSMKQMWKLGTRFEHEVSMREGGKLEVEEPAAIKTQTMASAGTPTTTVAAGDVQRMPANFQRTAANDGQYRLAM